MSTLLALLMMILTSSLADVPASTTEKYMYVVYYEENNCELSAVSFTGFNSGDREVALGGSDNATGLCSMESLCLLHNDIELCQTHLVQTFKAAIQMNIDFFGHIVECDDSNDLVNQPSCGTFEGCMRSSVYAHCAYQVATTTELLNHPDLIRNQNAFEDDSLDLQSYLLMYSDNECTKFQGAQGIVAGNHTLSATPDSMSCEDTIACILFPEGELCARHGGTTGETMSLRTKEAASKAIICTNETEESCEEIDPNECVQSAVFPSCWQRVVTGKRLFAEPNEYITSGKTVQTSPPDSQPVGETLLPTSSAGRLHGTLLAIVLMTSFVPLLRTREWHL